MRSFLRLPLVLLAYLLCSCTPLNSQPPGVTNIYVDPNSDLGRSISSLDAVGRAHQNRNVFTSTLRSYEKSHEPSCADVQFGALREPGEIIGKQKRKYVIDGVSSTCGNRA